MFKAMSVFSRIIRARASGRRDWPRKKSIVSKKVRILVTNGSTLANSRVIQHSGRWRGYSFTLEENP
jgi:hypothetical protein